MANHHCDLLVIGAGASGASVAYEAIRRGLSVAILEAGDIGGGTSCRSTKLLHGGVRYLELAFKTLDLAQLQLVREALMERGHWLRTAPFLADRLELVLPTKNWFDKTYYGLGLGLYDALSGKTGLGHSRRLSRDELVQALPQLCPRQGGVAYSDGQFDDARLNLLLALTAEQGGATLRRSCRVIGFERNPDGQLRAAISETTTGLQERWVARVIVNTTGIHADSIRCLADPEAPQRLLTSRGTHLVLKDNLCPQGMGLLVPATETDGFCSCFRFSVKPWSAQRTRPVNKARLSFLQTTRGLPAPVCADVVPGFEGPRREQPLGRRASSSHARRKRKKQQPGCPRTRGGNTALRSGEFDGREMDHLQTDGPGLPGGCRTSAPVAHAKATVAAAAGDGHGP